MHHLKAYDAARHRHFDADRPVDDLFVVEAVYDRTSTLHGRAQTLSLRSNELGEPDRIGGRPNIAALRVTLAELDQ